MRLLAAIAGVVCAASLVNAASAQAPLVSGSDGTVCDFVAANAGRNIVFEDKTKGSVSPNYNEPFEKFLLRDAIADVDGDGDAEVLSTYGTNGDTPHVIGLKQGYKFEDTLPEGADPNDLLRWTKRGQWLNFKGDWHAIEFADRSLKQAVSVYSYTKQGAFYACTFLPRNEESLAFWVQDGAIAKVYNDTRKRGTSESFKAGRGGALTENDKRDLMTLSAASKADEDHWSGIKGPFREVTVDFKTALVAADLDGDGVKERTAAMELQSGAGCGAVWFELLPNAGKAEPNKAKRDLIRNLQHVSVSDGGWPAPCGSVSELIEISGRGYIYVERADSSLVDRKLLRLDSGRLSSVAESNFSAAHTVVYDRAKGGLLKPPN